MTYEEAKKLKVEWLKDSIKIRLYNYNPVKYASFKGIVERNKVIHSEDIINAMDVVFTIDKHENGNIFERNDLFYDILKRKSR